MSVSTTAPVTHVVTGSMDLIASDAISFATNVDVAAALEQAIAGLLMDADASSGSVDLSDFGGSLTFVYSIVASSAEHAETITSAMANIEYERVALCFECGTHQRQRINH